MPRYHFNVFDGSTFIDEEGHECTGVDEARVHAIGLAGAIIRDDAKRVGLGEDWCMEVTDDHGLLLFRLDFHVAEAPAVMGRKRPEPA